MTLYYVSYGDNGAVSGSWLIQGPQDEENIKDKSVLVPLEDPDVEFVAVKHKTGHIAVYQRMESDG